MKQPSSTISAAAIYGAIAALLFGVLAVFAPEYYERVPPGMEAGSAVLIGVIAGYFKRENVLPVKRAK
jgi:hypothetical protein